ncbi:MAG: hypothetical protein ACI8RZ_003093, partial [Myxococcota bacterium]
MSRRPDRHMEAWQALQVSPPPWLKLAIAASPAVRISTALLRALREALYPDLDAGDEMAVWYCPLVSTRSAQGIGFERAVTQRMRQAIPLADLAVIVQVFVVIHADIPSAIRQEEDLVFAVLKGETDQIPGMLLRILKSFEDAAHPRSLARWALRALQLQPDAVRQTPEAWLLAQRAVAALGRGQNPLQVPQTGLELLPLAAVLGEVPTIEVGVAFSEGGFSLSIPPSAGDHIIDLPDLPGPLILGLSREGRPPRWHAIPREAPRLFVVPQPPVILTGLHRKRWRLDPGEGEAVDDPRIRFTPLLRRYSEKALVGIERERQALEKRLRGPQGLALVGEDEEPASLIRLGLSGTVAYVAGPSSSDDAALEYAVQEGLLDTGIALHEADTFTEENLSKALWEDRALVLWVSVAGPSALQHALLARAAKREIPVLWAVSGWSAPTSAEHVVTCTDAETTQAQIRWALEGLLRPAAPVVVEGFAGSGTTALLLSANRHLSGRGALIARHHFDPLHASMMDPEAAERSLIAMVCRFLRLPLQPTLWQALLAARDALQQRRARLVVFIDGLHEVCQTHGDVLARWLGHQGTRRPPVPAPIALVVGLRAPGRHTPSDSLIADAGMSPAALYARYADGAATIDMRNSRAPYAVLAAMNLAPATRSRETWWVSRVGLLQAALHFHPSRPPLPDVLDEDVANAFRELVLSEADLTALAMLAVAEMPLPLPVSDTLTDGRAPLVQRLPGERVRLTPAVVPVVLDILDAIAPDIPHCAQAHRALAHVWPPPPAWRDHTLRRGVDHRLATDDRQGARALLATPGYFAGLVGGGLLNAKSRQLDELGLHVFRDLSPRILLPLRTRPEEAAATLHRALIEYSRMTPEDATALLTTPPRLRLTAQPLPTAPARYQPTTLVGAHVEDMALTAWSRQGRLIHWRTDERVEHEFNQRLSAWAWLQDRLVTFDTTGRLLAWTSEGSKVDPEQVLPTPTAVRRLTDTGDLATHGKDASRLLMGAADGTVQIGRWLSAHPPASGGAFVIEDDALPVDGQPNTGLCAASGLLLAWSRARLRSRYSDRIHTFTPDDGQTILSAACLDGGRYVVLMQDGRLLVRSAKGNQTITSTPCETLLDSENIRVLHRPDARRDVVVAIGSDGTLGTLWFEPEALRFVTHWKS